MKKTFAILILIVIAISACSPSSTPFPTVPSSAPTETLEAIVPTSTQTSIPTETQTPSPTSIPLTPTLDVASLVTFTPAPPARCPATDENKRLSMGYVLQKPDATAGQIADPVLEFLNNGGSLKSAQEGLDKEAGNIIKAFILDLTNDGREELVLQRSPYLFIFGCDAGGYKVIYQIDNKDGEVLIYALQDYNMNGVPEIIFRRTYPASVKHSGYFVVGYVFSSYYFLEWKGQEFQNILTGEFVDHDGLIISSDNPFGIPAVTILGKTIATDAENQNAWDAVDYDHNGLKDIRIVSGDLFPDQEELYPFRQAILTLSWNGEMYVPFQIMYKAVYRTDVVRDADAAFLMGSYEQALLLYTEVIQNEKLRDRASIRHDGLNYFIPQKKMKAYAYYRMMLTHVVQGNLDEALKAYNTLQNQFANDSDASPIAMMAAQFWNQYQSTHEVASSCSKVIGFVNTHPDVLASFALSPYWPTPGEDYEPKDLCPIK